MFWFKHKQTVLDCFTTDGFAFQHAKIAPATQYYPEWWRDLPPQLVGPSGHSINTMKVCSGMNSYYKRSFMLPSWGICKISLSDLSQGVSEWQTNYKIDGVKPDQTLVQHDRFQYGNFVDAKKYQHYKIVSPWYLKTDDSIDFSVTDPLYNRQDIANYSVLPGIVNFKYQRTTNINMMIEMTDKAKIIEFNPGDAIAMFTPLTEKQIVLKHHLISIKDLEKIDPLRRFVGLGAGPVFGGSYNSFKRYLKKNETHEQSKCPFGFKK